MRIYYEERELFYIDIPEADDFDEALQIAQDRMDNDELVWLKIRATGKIDTHWHDEETNSMLQD